ncbi:MAG: threonine aldolase [Oscillospiraceae bacterium]|nr:threonine aldolase [Oscillospiraceae bacterium]
MKIIDLRSDTVTRPTKEMYDAITVAEVGDDVARDDPTTARLEKLAAKMLGKEAALFVASGTMGNIVASLAHEVRGKEVILGAESHMFNMEVGGISVLAGGIARTLNYPGEVPDVKMIEAAFRPADIHQVRAGLICLENALGNGRVVPREVMADVYALAGSRGVPVHVDGARVFNAAAALGIDVKELTQYCDTVSCCLSKGLCSPVGAILAGNEGFVEKARAYRKMLGGGMRQSGVISAAGIVSLEVMTKRLLEDHENARYLASALNGMDNITVDMEAVEINMVFAGIDKSPAWKAALPARLLERGIKIYGEMSRGFRFLTHNDVTRQDIDRFLGELTELLAM